MIASKRRVRTGRLQHRLRKLSVHAIKLRMVVLCRDEKHQVELLGRFNAEGLTCKALLS